MSLFTIPNILSATRLALVPPTVQALLSERFAAAAFLIGFCGILDVMDGIAARRLRQETDLGKVLDPMADKLLSGAVLLALTAMDRIPVWFVILAIGRDVGIVLAAVFIFRKKQYITPSVPAGKVAFASLAAVMLVATLAPSLIFPFLIASAAALVWSSASYARATFGLVSIDKLARPRWRASA